LLRSTACGLGLYGSARVDVVILVVDVVEVVVVVTFLEVVVVEGIAVVVDAIVDEVESSFFASFPAHPLNKSIAIKANAKKRTTTDI